MTYQSIENLAKGSRSVGSTTEVSMVAVAKKADSKKALGYTKVCSGNTKYTEENVLASYIRNKGVVAYIADELGYHVTTAGSCAVVKRLRDMGPEKLRLANSKIKLSKELPPTQIIPKGKPPLFFRIERLLEYYYANKYKGTYPDSFNEWNPEDTEFWGKLFVRKDQLPDDENIFFDFWANKRAEARAAGTLGG